MMVQRSWDGVEAALFDTLAGQTRLPASSRHWIGFHVGRPVRATCRVGGRLQSRLQTRGDADLVPAGMPGVWEDDRATRILRLSLAPALIASAATDMGLDPARLDLVPLFQLRDPRIGHIASAFEAELLSDLPSDPLYAQSLGIALASRLVVHCRGSSGEPSALSRGLSRRALDRVTEYVEEHLDGSLSLEELARLAGVGPSHFKTLFARSMRVPVHQYVVRRRVERARLLVETDAMPLGEVALRSGFSDQSHMARWMRRILGTTPAELRRASTSKAT